jgi:hypothetical protein
MQATRLPLQQWAKIERSRLCHWTLSVCSRFIGVERWAFAAPVDACELGLVTQTLLVSMCLHAFAALVLCDFCFPSFFKRAHSDFQICESRFNHRIRRIATQFAAHSPDDCLSLVSSCGFCATMIMLFHRKGTLPAPMKRTTLKPPSFNSCDRVLRDQNLM